MLPDYYIIGKRIKSSRINAKITQEQLANKMNISVAFVSRIERGTAAINLKRLIQIAQILNVTPAYLLSGVHEESKSYLREDMAQLLERCNPYKQKLIYQISELVANCKIYLD